MLSTGKNLATALVSAGMLAFFAVVYGAYTKEFESASIMYHAIWYILFAGSGFLFVGACIAAVLSLTKKQEG